jgi:hypothetical protein
VATVQPATDPATGGVTVTSLATGPGLVEEHHRFPRCGKPGGIAIGRAGSFLGPNRPSNSHRRSMNSIRDSNRPVWRIAVRRVMGVLAHHNRSWFRPTTRKPGQGPPKTRNRCSAWTPCIQQIPQSRRLREPRQNGSNLLDDEPAECANGSPLRLHQPELHAHGSCRVRWPPPRPIRAASDVARPNRSVSMRQDTRLITATRHACRSGYIPVCR